MKPEKKPESIINLSLFILSGAHMVTHVFGRIHPALFPVFRDEFQLSLQQLGLVASIPTLLRMLFYLPSGLLSDKLGQKALIIMSFIIAGLSSFALSLSQDIITLILFLSILNAAITFYHPPAYSLTSELFSKSKRGQALGIHGAGGTLGMALGPISLSILLAGISNDWRNIYLFWSFPILLYIIAIWKLKPTQQTAVKDSSFPAKSSEPSSPGLRSIFTIGVLGFLGFQATRQLGSQIVQTFIPTYIHDSLGISVADAGLIYGMATLTGVVAAPIGGFLSDRFGDKRWLSIALGVYAILLFASSLTSNILLFTLLYWSSGFFSTSSMGAASSIIARSIPSDHRGLGFALYFLPGSIVGIVAPLIGATIADVFGLWSIFPAAILLIGIGFLLLKYGVSSE
ncbi:MAG: MFS transporter [Candidatus Bathyarchaeota archaeon]|nr:MFS transporter [Candidatus Bathyarchaeota archaeon]